MVLSFLAMRVGESARRAGRQVQAYRPFASPSVGQPPLSSSDGRWREMTRPRHRGTRKSAPGSVAGGR